LDNGTGPVELILSSGWADRMLQVILKNRVSDQDVSPGNGFGLEYIERRMFLLFGRSGLITRQQISDQFIITLNIPQIA
jgi:LytS/YehU family sensor histidine kinase